MLECVLHIGENPEQPDMGEQETRGAVLSPQSSGCTGVRAVEEVGEEEEQGEGGGQHLPSPGQRKLTGKRYLLPTPATSGSCGKAAL